MPKFTTRMAIANTTAIGREVGVRAGGSAENHRNQANRLAPCAGWLASKTMNQIDAQFCNREHRHAVATQLITNRRLVAIVIARDIISLYSRSPQCRSLVGVAHVSAGYGSSTYRPTCFRRIPGATVGIIAGGDFRQIIPARMVWTQRAGADLWSLAGLEFLETLPGKVLRPVPSAHEG
jgi:hypothetical protein